MTRTETQAHRRLVAALHTEALLLADEARGYFDEAGRADRDALPALDRVTFSCESLKVTTRLMHVIAWLLTQRAVEAGELGPADALAPERRLGDAPVTDDASFAALPMRARWLVRASAELHRRVAFLEAALDRPAPPASPARHMQERLAMAF
jgi:regulator of CtrA degradation